MKKFTLLVWVCLAVLGFGQIAGAQEAAIQKTAATNATGSDKEQDGLNGPVRRVRIETATIVVKDGKLIERSRVARGATTYDFNGQRIDTSVRSVESSAPPGKQQYRYDDKGNIIEMVVRGDDDSILRKESYQYEFDELGNWKKMITLVAVYEDGKLSFEPIEVTYRMIAYYYSQGMDKAASASRPSAAPEPSKNLVPEKSIPGPQTAERANARESTTVGDGNRAGAAGRTEGNGSGNKNLATPAVSSAPEVGASAKDGSVKTADTQSAPSEDADQYYQQGLSHLMAGRYAEALDDLRQAVYLNPENALAYAKLGVAYAGLKQYKETVVVLKLALRIKAQVVDAEAYYRLGEAYTSLGKHSEALDAFKQAMYITRAQVLESDPNKAAFPTVAHLHYGLGLANQNLGRLNEAINQLKKAIDLKPEFAEAYYAMALAHVGLEDRKSAEKEERILRRLSPALADKVVAAIHAPPVVPAGTMDLGPRRRP